MTQWSMILYSLIFSGTAPDLHKFALLRAPIKINTTTLGTTVRSVWSTVRLNMRRNIWDLREATVCENVWYKQFEGGAFCRFPKGYFFFLNLSTSEYRTQAWICYFWDDHESSFFVIFRTGVTRYYLITHLLSYPQFKVYSCLDPL